MMRATAITLALCSVGPMARQMKELGMPLPLLGGETINTAKFRSRERTAPYSCAGNRV